MFTVGRENVRHDTIVMLTDGAVYIINSGHLLGRRNMIIIPKVNAKGVMHGHNYNA